MLIKDKKRLSDNNKGSAHLINHTQVTTETNHFATERKQKQNPHIKYARLSVWQNYMDIDMKKIYLVMVHENMMIQILRRNKDKLRVNHHVIVTMTVKVPIISSCRSSLGVQLGLAKVLRRCCVLEGEICKLKEELLSAYEIIRVLQEEQKELQHIVSNSRPNIDTSISEDNVKWRKVINKNHLRKENKSGQQIPVIINRYAVLQEEQQPARLINGRNNEICGSSKEIQKNKEKHRVIIVGDSHMRGFANNITATSKINSNIEVVGYVKPNAGTKAILDNEYDIAESAPTENTHVYVYADMVITATSRQDLQDALNNLTVWARDNELEINLQKTAAM
ncbi:hypothetical protein C0J52_23601, partial [Blattella germanica]